MLFLLAAAPAKASLVSAATVGILALLLDVALVVIFVWALVVVIKLPALLERQCSLLNQLQGTQREILVEIRSVTRQE